MTEKRAAPLRTWRVVDVHGEMHELSAHWLFKDNGGLTFRLRSEADHTGGEIAMFAPGQWTSCLLLKRQEEGDKDEA